MRYSFVQDHFQYLASPFLIALGVAAGVRGLQRLGPSAVRAGPIVACVLLAVLCTLSWRQTRQFESEEVLWLITLEKNPQAWMAHHQLASLRVQQGRVPEAMDRFERVLSLNPYVAEAHGSLGSLLAQQGRLREAEEHLRAAVRIQPLYSRAYLLLAEVLRKLGREDEARAIEAERQRILTPGRS
jgi:Flp pilus assembly protein TadD